MAGFMKNAMSYLGMSDVAEDDDFTVDKRNGDEDGAFDSDHTVTPITAASSSSSSRTSTPANSAASRRFIRNPMRMRRWSAVPFATACRSS